MNIRTFVAKSAIWFSENEGGGQRPFGTFPKIHPFWRRRLSLTFALCDGPGGRYCPAQASFNPRWDYTPASNFHCQGPLLISFQFTAAQALLGLLIVVYHKPDLSVQVMLLMLIITTVQQTKKLKIEFSKNISKKEQTCSDYLKVRFANFQE